MLWVVKCLMSLVQGSMCHAYAISP